jgi:hypothetical protein
MLRSNKTTNYTIKILAHVEDRKTVGSSVGTKRILIPIPQPPERKREKA